MSCNLDFIQQYAAFRHAELTREADHERLIDLATGPARPFRARLARWLYATAARIEGAPRQPIYRPEAA